MTEEITSSPTPDQIPADTVGQTTMPFHEAVKAIGEGKRITKLEWGNKEFYGELKDGILKLHKPDGQWYNWLVNDGDLLGEDWIILN